jgi:hypothetical protein
MCCKCLFKASAWLEPSRSVSECTQQHIAPQAIVKRMYFKCTPMYEDYFHSLVFRAWSLPATQLFVNSFFSIIKKHLAICMLCKMSWSILYFLGNTLFQVLKFIRSKKGTQTFHKTITYSEILVTLWKWSTRETLVAQIVLNGCILFLLLFESCHYVSDKID